jgi:NAD(P)-dependent dehydrogenase (short-subunit alcohol dehydrogenase family)
MAEKVWMIEGLTEARHDEVAPLGSHATVVKPGFFRTSWTAGRSAGP